MLLLDMVEVVLVLGKPTSNPRNIFLAETGMVGIFRNLSVSTQRPPWSYLRVGMIQLVLLMVLCLVFLLYTVKVVWILGTPTLPTKKFIVGLMLKICVIKE